MSPVKAEGGCNNQMFIGGKEINIVDDEISVTECVKSVIDARKDEYDSDAFHVVSLSSLLYKWRHWFTCMPRVHPHYAIKANPDTAIIKFLSILGSNFDCASQGEIERVLALGISPDRIIYAHTTKPIKSILYAKKHGVDLMTFDNVEELQKIKMHFPGARLVLRIAVADMTAIVKLNKKFGVEPEHEAPKLLTTALDMQLNVVGISFHVGCFCTDFSTYEKAIRHARNLFDLALQRGQHMTLVDIGGGFPGY